MRNKRSWCRRRCSSQTALQKPDVDPTKEAVGNTVDASHCGSSQSNKDSRSSSDSKEKTGNALGASQTVRTANVAETPGAAPVVKEAAKNAEGASQIVRTANVAETPGAALAVKEAAKNAKRTS